MAELQFGVNLHGTASGEEFRRLVSRADELGYDVFAAPDHLGAHGAVRGAAAAAGMVSGRGCGCGPTC